jgi:hypothetical protein
MKVTGCQLYLMILINADYVFDRTNQDMKRKIQHSAVNNQEDEDSCTRPACFPNDAQLDKKEEKPDENSHSHLPYETPTDKGEMTK